MPAAGGKTMKQGALDEVWIEVERLRIELRSET
jgi:hypothetical protein